jgi:signal transduction histidine kinase
LVAQALCFASGALSIVAVVILQPVLQAELGNGPSWALVVAGTVLVCSAVLWVGRVRGGHDRPTECGFRWEEPYCVSEQVLENIPEGVALVDPEQRVVRANSSARALLACYGESEDGRLLRIAGRPIDGFLDQPRGATSEILELEGEGKRALQVYGRRLPEQSLSGGVLTIRDVTTERRVAERAKGHARLAAVGELAAGVAHDFNNLLQGIAVLAEALREHSGMPRQARADIDTILEQTELGSRVTRQLLEFSRSSPLTRKLYDLGELLERVCPMLARALPSKISFELEAADRSYPVLADPALIQQMVANLVINARDALPDGGRVAVRLSHLNGEAEALALPEESSGGTWLKLTVEDSGCGMPPEVQARAFEPFFTTKERNAGTGLGLAQVYGIVRQHDGHVRLDSEPGSGTVVSVFLPVHPIEAVGLLTPEERVLARARAASAYATALHHSR